jgi:HD-GYP domain-containing protein (c-di-GMP phosphodiesterase class II)/predicted hydrocarbon binding protein
MEKNPAIGPSDKLYNSRITATYVKFLRKNYRYANIGDILSYAGMETYQVEDEAHWFTQEQVDRFNERMTKITGNPNIAREVGRLGFSPDSIGFVKSYTLGRISIGKAYEMITQISSKFVKSSTYESERLAPNKAKIIVTPKPGAQEKPYQCQNRIGYFEAFCSLFRRKFPRVEHTKCIFNGDSSCEYEVTWREFRYEFWDKARMLAGGLLLAIAIAAFWSGSSAGLIAIIVALAVLLVFSTLVWNLERKELNAGIDNLSRSTDEVVKKMETSRKNMDFTRQIIVSLSLQKSREGMMEQITLLFEKELDYDRGMIYLANKERSKLLFCGSFGYAEEYLPTLKKMDPSLRLDSTGIFTVCFRERRPFLINDVDEIAGKLSPRSLEFARQMRTKAFICVPIISSNDSIGVLAVDNLISKRPLLQSDLDLLMSIAPEIGMGIQNVTAIEDKERQFHSILQVLASSIDARDPLTAGHSERVTRFAVGIAREMLLPDDTVEMIRVAALLHDYGKIGIADEILKKPGKLTSTEYEEIKTHATKTKQILDKIEFQGIYQDVSDVASSHHEKFDGTGYPAGLGHIDIPLGARILAVADVFEAITAKRHYRGPMLLSEAFELLQRDRGKHFDPEVLDAFIRFYEKEGKLEDSLYAEIEPTTRDGENGHAPFPGVLDIPHKRSIAMVTRNSKQR